MKLIRLVCFEFSIDPDAIFKNKLSSSAKKARNVLIYLLYGNKLPDEIVVMLGLPGKGTVYYALAWVRDKMVIEKSFKKKVEKLKKEFKQWN